MNYEKILLQWEALLISNKTQKFIIYDLSRF